MCFQTAIGQPQCLKQTWIISFIVCASTNCRRPYRIDRHRAQIAQSRIEVFEEVFIGQKGNGYTALLIGVKGVEQKLGGIPDFSQLQRQTGRSRIEIIDIGGYLITQIVGDDGVCRLATQTSQGVNFDAQQGP